MFSGVTAELPLWAMTANCMLYDGCNKADGVVVAPVADFVHSHERAQISDLALDYALAGSRLLAPGLCVLVRVSFS